MAKFFGNIGFGHTEETAPDVFTDGIIEKPYYGDVVRDSRGFREEEKVNFDLTVGNSISIVADDYANENAFAMKFVVWRGQAFHISNIDVEFPRLVLRLGEVYNGPRA